MRVRLTNLNRIQKYTTMIVLKWRVHKVFMRDMLQLFKTFKNCRINGINTFVVS